MPTPSELSFDSYRRSTMQVQYASRRTFKAAMATIRSNKATTTSPFGITPGSTCLIENYAESAAPPTRFEECSAREHALAPAIQQHELRGLWV